MACQKTRSIQWIIDRAINKIKSIKSDTIFWSYSSEAQQMIVNGEVSMGMVWLNRAKAVEEDTNGRYRLNMNEAIAMPGAYLVPKGIRPDVRM